MSRFLLNPELQNLHKENEHLKNKNKDPYFKNYIDYSTIKEVRKDPKYNTKKTIQGEDSPDEENTYKIPVKEKIVNDPCIVGDLNINNMYSKFQNKNSENKKINMAAWANNTNYICENDKNKTFIPDKNKSRVILCDEMKQIAMTCRNDIKIKKDLKNTEEKKERDQMEGEDELLRAKRLAAEEAEKRLAAEKAKRLAAEKKERGQMEGEDELLRAKRLAAEEEAKRLAAEEAKRQAEKSSKEIVLKELTLQNAWNDISTNNKLDSNKINQPGKLFEIAKSLKDPEIHTFNNETNTYIIPDGQFDELIKNIKKNIKFVTKDGLTQNYTIMDRSELTQEDINRHKDERTDFKAKNSKFYSSSLSKSWKNMPWKRGGIKTRKYKKGKKGKKGKSKKCKSKKCKTKKRNYK